MNYRRTFAGSEVFVLYAFFVLPLALGALDSRLMTPLALPGYLALTVGSSVGSYLFPNFALWVFWVPFLVGAYAVAVVLGAGVRHVRG